MSDNGVIVETPAATDILPDKCNQPGLVKHNGIVLDSLLIIY